MDPPVKGTIARFREDDWVLGFERFTATGEIGGGPRRAVGQRGRRGRIFVKTGRLIGEALDGGGDVTADLADGMTDNIFCLLKEIFVFFQSFRHGVKQFSGGFAAVFGAQKKSAEDADGETKHKTAE